MKNRNKIAALKKHYVKVPNRALRSGLDPISLCIYVFLCSYSEDYNPTLGKLAKELGIHRNTVCKALKRLEGVGLIRKLVQGQVIRQKGTQRADSQSKQSIYEFISLDDVE